MEKYNSIRHKLKTIFNVEHGFSNDEALDIYLQSISHKREEFENELREAFSDPDVSWIDMLCNDNYEVYCTDSEEVAKKYATNILVDPVLK